MVLARYQRQMLLPRIGEAGQKSLGDARVLIVGCGALGSGVGDQLARAGVGFLRIIDRDLVERTNLQRQILYAESDLDQPKAHAAAIRLRHINSEIEIDGVVAEANQSTIHKLASVNSQAVDLIIDGTDNVATRYLLNDFSVQQNIPWIYGGCVATEGRCMVIRPGVTPCLRCLFPEPPDEADLPTCDTAGILGAAAAIVGAMQATAAIQLLTGNVDDIPRGITMFDVWSGLWRRIATDAKPDSECIACGRRQFDSLRDDGLQTPTARVLCGRNAVQFRPPVDRFDLKTFSDHWQSAGEIRRGEQIVRFKPTIDAPVELTIFHDGRVIVHGVSDIERARILYERYLA